MVNIKNILLANTFSFVLFFIVSVLSHQVFASPSFDKRPEIRSYDKSLYSENSATVLRREIEISVDEQGFSNRRTYMAILLNDDASIQDYSQIEISHNTYSEDLNINFARVHNGDEVKYLKDDAITRQNLSSENYLYDNERTLFSLPTLRKDAVIEFEYTQKSKKATIPGHFNTRLGFYWWEAKAGNVGARLDPVVESLVKITYPETMEMNYRQSSLIQVEPNKSVTLSKTTLEWASENLPELKHEDWMPEDINLYPVIYVSSLAGWKDLNSWAHSLFKPHVSQDEKIKLVAKEIKKTATSDQERIKSVFDYMEKNIRYVYAHVGRNGYEPHDALDVLSNGYGDCKDQTVLTISILKALGIKAYPALIASQGSEMSKDMPRNYFNHMFVYIPSAKGRPEMWFDTTASKLDFPGIHWSLQGKPALVVNGSDNVMKEVITDPAVKHLAQVNVSFSSEKGVDIDINLDVIYSGLLGQNVVSMLNYAPDKDALIKHMLSSIYPKAKLTVTAHEKLEDKKDTYKLSAKFVAKDAWKGSPQAFNISTGISQFVGLAYDVLSIDEPIKRTQPFQTSKSVELRLSMTIPQPNENYAPITITTSPDYNDEYFNLKQSGTVKDNGDYLVETVLTSKEVIVLVEKYENYYRSTKNLLEMPPWYISYQIDEKALELSKINLNFESTDLKEMLNNAEIYLNNGEFSDALKFADKAILLDSNNAKAHYLRGVSLGYQQQFDESNISFSRALELGYEL